MNIDFEKITRSIVPVVIDQHASSTANKWLLRNDAVSAPHYTLDDIADLDEKVVANIDGLRISGEAGWELCKKPLEGGWPAEYFAASILAFESGDGSRISEVLEKAAESEDSDVYKGITSALGWMPYEKAESFIRQFLDSPLPEQRYIGIAGAAIHRKAPGHQLYNALQDTNPLVLSRALKAAAELRISGDTILNSAEISMVSPELYRAWQIPTVEL